MSVSKNHNKRERACSEGKPLLRKPPAKSFPRRRESRKGPLRALDPRSGSGMTCFRSVVFSESEFFACEARSFSSLWCLEKDSTMF